MCDNIDSRLTHSIKSARFSPSNVLYNGFIMPLQQTTELTDDTINTPNSGNSINESTLLNNCINTLNPLIGSLQPTNSLNPSINSSPLMNSSTLSSSNSIQLVNNSNESAISIRPSDLNVNLNSRPMCEWIEENSFKMLENSNKYSESKILVKSLKNKSNQIEQPIDTGCMIKNQSVSNWTVDQGVMNNDVAIDLSRSRKRNNDLANVQTEVLDLTRVRSDSLRKETFQTSNLTMADHLNPKLYTSRSEPDFRSAQSPVASVSPDNHCCRTRFIRSNYESTNSNCNTSLGSFDSRLSTSASPISTSRNSNETLTCSSPESDQINFPGSLATNLSVLLSSEKRVGKSEINQSNLIRYHNESYEIPNNCNQDRSNDSSNLTNSLTGNHRNKQNWMDDRMLKDYDRSMSKKIIEKNSRRFAINELFNDILNDDSSIENTQMNLHVDKRSKLTLHSTINDNESLNDLSNGLRETSSDDSRTGKSDRNRVSDKRERNRQAASRCRKKKLDRIKQLEGETQMHLNQIEQMRLQIDRLKGFIVYLRQEWHCHTIHGCD